jgi:hypothetical protein
VRSEITEQPDVSQYFGFRAEKYATKQIQIQTAWLFADDDLDPPILLPAVGIVGSVRLGIGGNGIFGAEALGFKGDVAKFLFVDEPGFDRGGALV